MEQKEHKKLLSHETKSGLMTILLLMVVVLLSVFATMQLFNQAERKCYEDLAANTHDAIETFDANVRSDRMTLRLLAGLIAEEDTLESISVSRYLTIYDVNSQLGSSGILLPDNSTLTSAGHLMGVSDIMDFKEELTGGEHLTGIQQSEKVRADKVIRSFEPLRQHGTTVGLLYGAYNPSKMAELWIPPSYSGEASVYVVNREAKFYILLKSDITDVIQEQRKQNELLASALQEAQQANAAKTSFLQGSPCGILQR